jgi:protein-L-isoaspartate O-methyltransferase
MRSLLPALTIAAAVVLLSMPAASAQAPAARARHKADVVYVPTPQPVVEAMLALAGVKKTDVVYDLGSGDGRIVITAAQKYGARGVGIELDPALVKKARANAAAAGVSSRVRFVTQNLFDADLRPATVVTLYLLQSLNERLRPKLVRELSPGTRVVSHVFNMGPEWPPERTETVDRSRIYLWSISNR